MNQPAKAPRKLNGWRLVGKIILTIIWVGSVVIATQLLIGYLLLWLVGEEKFTQPVWTAIYAALYYTVAMLIIILAPLRFRRIKQKNPPSSGKPTSIRKELGLTGLPTWTDIGLAPVGFVAYLLIAALVTTIFAFFPWFDAGQTQDVGFSFASSGIDRGLAFLTLVVVAPIAEEVIFRGWLYGKLRSQLSAKISNHASMILAILLVSVLFGAMHMQWNVGVNVFAMSVVLCGLREITGTIYAGILLHMIKNGIAFYLLFVMGVA